MMRILEVTWIDSATLHNWHDRSKHVAQRPLVCRTVGFVLKDDAECIVLVQSLSDETDAASEGTVIPRSCIKKRRRLG